MTPKMRQAEPPPNTRHLITRGHQCHRPKRDAMSSGRLPVLDQTDPGCGWMAVNRWTTRGMAGQGGCGPLAILIDTNGAGWHVDESVARGPDNQKKALASCFAVR